MDISIRDTGLFGHVDVTLNPGDTFSSEAGALFKMSSNTQLETAARQRGRGGGGILSAAKRLLGGASFFLTHYSSKDGQPAFTVLVGLKPGRKEKICGPPQTPELPS